MSAEKLHGRPRSWRTSIAYTLRELRELGYAGSSFRVKHELGLRARTLLYRVRPATVPAARFAAPPTLRWFADASPFAPPAEVRAAVADRLAPAARDAVLELARRAARGRIRAFSSWEADYGDPIDWSLDPTTGQRWPTDEPWSAVLRHAARVGDVKIAWEPARFPQAFLLARAAALHPAHAGKLGAALGRQIQGFIDATPYGLGIHWLSGQELALRLLAWTHAMPALAALGVDLKPLAARVATYAYQSVVHIEREIDYARHAVHNNHAVAEAVGLQLGARLLPCADAPRWEALSVAQLTFECERQFKSDGAYTQNSHNYHRAVLKDLFWAVGLRRRQGAPVPAEWLRVVERSLDFLYAHQNPADGSLPNYGANDGSHPAPLSTCAFRDFRPTLQVASYLTRGERLYDAGPWDEALTWWCGAAALEAPLRARRRTTVSFPTSGYHVLRGDDEATFAAFRCGNVVDRFAQIDMLHLNVVWRGENVLIDGGSYMYNGPQDIYQHLFRTESHNTVRVDGADQMVHWRRFKNLYWTRGRLIELRDAANHIACTGEHYGYRRLADPVTHTRAVLMWKCGLWVVLDTLRARGEHSARLHWLAGDFPHEHRGHALDLRTPAGDFRVAVYDREARPLAGELVRGREHPPRGWSARHYGERTPALSFSVESRGVARSFLTVLGPGHVRLEREGERYALRTDAGDVRFAIEGDALRARD